MFEEENMMDRIKIAKELVVMAKKLVALNHEETEYVNNVMKYIDECFNQRYVVSKQSGIKYNVRYENRNFKLIALEGRNDIPEDEYVDESEIAKMYNDAIVELRSKYHTIDGYDTIRTWCIESEENHYMLNNRDFTVKDDRGNVVDTTKEFDEDVNNNTKDLCFEYIDNNALVDYDAHINFIRSDGKDSGVTQELDWNNFDTLKENQV